MWKAILWQQFGGAIDMLENAVVSCPDELWSDRSQRPEFWYVAFHTLFFLDFYLSDRMEGFAPPAPFTLTELDPEGVLPERVYTKSELITFLQHGRNKCRAVIGALNDRRLQTRRRFGNIEGTVAELLLYNLRHVQHHAAQLNLILRQQTDSAPRWVSRTKALLEDSPRRKAGVSREPKTQRRSPAGKAAKPKRAHR